MWILFYQSSEQFDIFYNSILWVLVWKRYCFANPVNIYLWVLGIWVDFFDPKENSLRQWQLHIRIKCSQFVPIFCPSIFRNPWVIQIMVECAAIGSCLQFQGGQVAPFSHLSSQYTHPCHYYRVKVLGRHSILMISSYYTSFLILPPSLHLLHLSFGVPPLPSLALSCCPPPSPITLPLSLSPFL